MWLQIAPETVGEREDVCNMCALTKITKTRVAKFAEKRAEGKLERAFTDVMRPLRKELMSGFQFCIVFAEQFTNLVFKDLLKAKSESLASPKNFLSVCGRPRN